MFASRRFVQSMNPLVRGVRGMSSGLPSDFQYLTLVQSGATVRVNLNRPDVHNAFNEDVIAEITRAFTSITALVKSEVAAKPVADNTTTLPRSVILTGNGPSFSAGADLNWMAKMAKYTEQQNKEDSYGLYDMFHSIYNCPVPVIAAVNGAALGGGSGIIAACDYAFAVESAKMGFTEVALGLIPAVISRFCIDKIGVANAARYFVTGERFSATEGKRIGLIQEVYPTQEELMQAVEKTAGIINNNSPAAVRAAKQLVKDVTQKQLSLDKQETKEFTTSRIASIRVSAEGQAGLNAFLNKKSAPWKL